MAEVVTTTAVADQAARDRIADDLATTLFVEAGAGSGKTTALVGRVLALVLGGHAELSSIAAITFTEKAGAELRDRIRESLELAAESDPESERRERAQRALEQLDGAAIGTLHAFAQRLLTEHPVEVGLPRGSRCSTKSVRRWPSMPAGRHFATSSLRTGRSNARSCSCSARA